MCIEHLIRIIAGSMILISLALSHWVNRNWLWLTAFVGVNLIQSGFTKWCLMETILKRCGLGQSCCASASAPPQSS